MSSPPSTKSFIEPFPRPLPDDMITHLCGTLDREKDMPTLLALQRTCRAGWKGSTPVIWKKVHIRKMKDWFSILASIDGIEERLWRRKKEDFMAGLGASLNQVEDAIRTGISVVDMKRSVVQDMWDIVTSPTSDPWSMTSLLVVHILPNQEVSDLIRKLHRALDVLRPAHRRDRGIFDQLVGLQIAISLAQTYPIAATSMRYLIPDSTITCINSVKGSSGGERHNHVDLDALPHLPNLRCHQFDYRRRTFAFLLHHRGSCRAFHKRLVDEQVTLRLRDFSALSAALLASKGSHPRNELTFYNLPRNVLDLWDGELMDQAAAPKKGESPTVPFVNIDGRYRNPHWGFYGVGSDTKPCEVCGCESLVFPSEGLVDPWQQ
jgi:hypothetical protein